MTKQEHIEKGANLSVDVPYHYLLYFLEDDEELQHLAIEYRAGRIMSSEIKKKVTEVIWEILREHQEARRLITDEIVQLFMNPNRDFDHSRHAKKIIKNEAEDQHYLGFHFDPYFQSC